MDRQETDEAFTGGLLHDAGKLVLGQALAAQYRDALNKASERGIEPVQSEREVFGATHAEVGAYLLALWGLPDPVVAAVAYHHTPDALAGVAFGPVTAVHVANAFAHERQVQHECGSRSQLDTDHLSRLGLAPRVDAWRELIDPLLVDETCWSGSEGIAG